MAYTYSALRRFTRPRTFLYLMTLRTGTSLITFSLLLNKLTGVYGILALFTGYALSPLQLSMYIYSILALIVLGILTPHIRLQSPLQCLMLAWFYALDSLINALYTVAFGVAWFLVLARHTAPLPGSDPAHGPGGKTIDDTAGFTSPKFNVTAVDVVASPTPSAGAQIGLIGHEAADAAAASGVGGVLGTTILNSGGIASITVISALWALRLYFILMVMAYARGVLRQSIVTGAATSAPQRRLSEEQTAAGAAEGDSSGAAKTLSKEDVALAEASYLENPFLGVEGWKGKLGRLMVWIPRGYWLGPEVDEPNGDWMREVGGRFGRQKTAERAPTGVVERERRHRAGTGPPILKPIELGKVRK